jgi:hypothetical protein
MVTVHGKKWKKKSKKDHAFLLSYELAPCTTVTHNQNIGVILAFNGKKTFYFN